MKYGVIGDVCQSGMVFGVEFFKDKVMQEFVLGFVDQVVEVMCEWGVLLFKLGWYKNIFKICLLMIFLEEYLGLLVQMLDEVLVELVFQL